jgi:predicted transcriptional regulator
LGIDCSSSNRVPSDHYRDPRADRARDKCLKESLRFPHLTDAVGEEQFVKVRDAMTGNVLTMTPGRSLRDAAKFMADHNVGAVVIMDPEQPGPGIFTERDLVRSIGRGDDPDAEHVAEHLTSHAAFADIEWDLEEAADTMAKGGFRHLVVVQGGELCGIISMRDIMRVWRPSARPVATS